MMTKSRSGNAVALMIGIMVVAILAGVFVLGAFTPSVTTIGTVSSITIEQGYTMIRFVSNAGSVQCGNSYVPSTIHLGQMLEVYQPGGWNFAQSCQITVLG